MCNPAHLEQAPQSRHHPEQAPPGAGKPLSQIPLNFSLGCGPGHKTGTITVAATEVETNTAIAALLSLGSDLHPQDDEVDENATLVPLVPHDPVPGLIP